MKNCLVDCFRHHCFHPLSFICYLMSYFNSRVVFAWNIIWLICLELLRSKQDSFRFRMWYTETKTGSQLGCLSVWHCVLHSSVWYCLADCILLYCADWCHTWRRQSADCQWLCVFAASGAGEADVGSSKSLCRCFILRSCGAQFTISKTQSLFTLSYHVSLYTSADSVINRCLYVSCQLQ